MSPPDDNYIHQQIGTLSAEVDMLIEAKGAQKRSQTSAGLRYTDAWMK